MLTPIKKNPTPSSAISSTTRVLQFSNALLPAFALFGRADGRVESEDVQLQSCGLWFDEEFPVDDNPQFILDSMVWTMVYLTVNDWERHLFHDNYK